MDQFDFKEHIHQIESMTNEVIDSNIPKLNAELCMRQVIALKDEGFTHDEAIVLTCSLNSKK